MNTAEAVPAHPQRLRWQRKDFFNEYSFKRAFQPLRTPAVFARIAAATACYELIEAALTEIQMDETEPDAGRPAGNHNWGIEIK